MADLTCEKVEENKEEAGVEELFLELDHVIQKLEREDVSLEDSFTYYHKGMELLKTCNEKIDRVEKKMQILDEEGNTHEF